MSIKTIRRTVQALVIIMIAVIPILNKHNITVVTGTLYSLAVGPVWITDPAIGVQTMLTTRQADLTLLLSLLIPILVALVFGRVFCGWLCPQNTISELVDRLASRLGIKRRFTVAPSPIPRFVVLAVILVVTLLAGFPLVSLLSAPGIISVQAAKFIYEGTVGLELGLIGLIIITELFFARRVWCNALCPVGSFLALLRTRRTLKVSFSEGGGRTCQRCYECAASCRLGLNPVTGPLAPQCHNCGDCVDTCASLQGERGPLSFTFSCIAVRR